MQKFNQHNKNHLISQFEKALQMIKEMPVTRSCSDCLNYDMGGMGSGRCRLANAIPPAEVVAVGCEAHVFNPHDVPF